MTRYRDFFHPIPGGPTSRLEETQCVDSFYAEDLVIGSTVIDNDQFAMNNFSRFCEKNDLCVKVSKTKISNFERGELFPKQTDSAGGLIKGTSCRTTCISEESFGQNFLLTFTLTTLERNLENRCFLFKNGQSKVDISYLCISSAAVGCIAIKNFWKLSV